MPDSTITSGGLNSQPVSSTAAPADDMAHITQEMYKKNSELNDRNKTLALLRKIDEIVLSEVTDPKHISQNVSNLLVEEEFKLIAVLVRHDSLLSPLAIATSEKNAVINRYGPDRFLESSVSFLDKANILIKSVDEKKKIVLDSFIGVLGKSFSPEEESGIQKETGVKSVLLYPVIVRSEPIGLLIIGISEAEVELSAYKRDLIDRLAGVTGIALDNALLYQSIQEANERLKQLDKLKDEFVSLASHELRTPMTVIKSYIWMFLHKKGDSLEPKEREYLERAYGSTERLIKLVNDMLNVSRIESGRLKLEMKDLDIVKLVDTVVNELVPRAQELGLKLTLSKPTTPVKTLNGDADRIEQILINFIGNSLKFTPPGGFISVKLEANESDVLISVSDTGRGIKKEDLHKLFQKFGMISSAYLQKNINQGSGLGLYLSKSLIELHGGRVKVESAGENKGSSFSFTLPYNENKPHQEAGVVPAASSTGAEAVVSGVAAGITSVTVATPAPVVGDSGTGAK